MQFFWVVGGKLLGVNDMVSVSVLCVEDPCLGLGSGVVSAGVVLHILWVSAFSS